MAGARTRGAAAPRQRGCVRRLCSAPKLAAPRVMTQVCADQAADGSGSCRSVGRVSTLGAVCRGVSEVWCVVGVGSRLAWLSIFKETGQSSRQNPKKNPVGSQSSRRLAALDGPAALRHCVRCYLQKNTSLSCTFWEPDPAAPWLPSLLLPSVRGRRGWRGAAGWLWGCVPYASIVLCVLARTVAAPVSCLLSCIVWSCSMSCRTRIVREFVRARQPSHTARLRAFHSVKSACTASRERRGRRDQVFSVGW
jgi:hypothetical protein